MSLPISVRPSGTEADVIPPGARVSDAPGLTVVTFASPVVVVVVDWALPDVPERAEPDAVPEIPDDPLGDPLALLPDGICVVEPDIPDDPACEPLWPLAPPLADGICVVVVVPVLVPVEVPESALLLCCAIADTDIPKTSAAALTLLINNHFFINEISWKLGTVSNQRPHRWAVPPQCAVPQAAPMKVCG
jgi:hypothetical protein